MSNRVNILGGVAFLFVVSEVAEYIVEALATHNKEDSRLHDHTIEVVLFAYLVRTHTHTH